MRLFRAAVAIAWTALLTFFPLIAFPAHAAEESIGSVKKVSGHAAVVRDGQQTPAHPGFKLRSGDTLETGPFGSLGVVLRDDSLVSIGPASRLVIEKFLFVPAEGKLGITARLLRGTMAYVSGLIGRLAPESATFVTPVATIGVRGTRFAARISE